VFGWNGVNLGLYWVGLIISITKPNTLAKRKYIVEYNGTLNSNARFHGVVS
jgi:hypothetical protein